MAAFVGFCVQSNGIAFPWDLKGGPLAEDAASRLAYSDLAALASPADQWDAVPAAGKLQILGTLAVLEWVGETMEPHYMRGGQPGYYPSLKEVGAQHSCDTRRVSCPCPLRSRPQASHPSPSRRSTPPRRRATSRTRCRSTCGIRSASPRTSPPRRRSAPP